MLWDLLPPGPTRLPALCHSPSSARRVPGSGYQVSSPQNYYVHLCFSHSLPRYFSSSAIELKIFFDILLVTEGQGCSEMFLKVGGVG